MKVENLRFLFLTLAFFVVPLCLIGQNDWKLLIIEDVSMGFDALCLRSSVNNDVSKFSLRLPSDQKIQKIQWGNTNEFIWVHSSKMISDSLSSSFISKVGLDGRVLATKVLPYNTRFISSSPSDKRMLFSTQKDMRTINGRTFFIMDFESEKKIVELDLLNPESVYFPMSAWSVTEDSLLFALSKNSRTTDRPEVELDPGLYFLPLHDGGLKRQYELLPFQVEKKSFPFIFDSKTFDLFYISNEMDSLLCLNLMSGKASLRYHVPSAQDRIVQFNEVHGGDAFYVKIAKKKKLWRLKRPSFLEIIYFPSTKTFCEVKVNVSSSKLTSLRLAGRVKPK